MSMYKSKVLMGTSTYNKSSVTCKDHGTRFTNCLFVKLIILCKLLLNVWVVSKNNIKMTLFDIPNDFCWWICIELGTNFTFPTKTPIKILKLLQLWWNFFVWYFVSVES
jgi:hypothetical protein